ncbi:uncharacterized protein LOC113513756 [Galleria mellonella]|uniref:Uncharacterized protein LOC113513756 n=1 Tax=Galleria mellonella TaxID=7137 RepID=A0A6J1WP02_GALME|nr:uncharacterized protein LOC113513756 [Galleria mellonella]
MYIFKILIIFEVIFVKEINSTVLTDIAVSVAHSVFYNDRITAVIWCHNNCDDVTIFLSKFHGVTYCASFWNMTDGNIREMKIVLDYRQVVLFTSKSNEFEAYLKLIYEVMVVSIRIIVVANKDVTNLREIMNIAWKYDIADIFFLTMKDNKGRIFTYFPYSNGICGNTNPVLLNKITDVKEALTNKFKNFQGCSIKFTLIYYEPYIQYDVVNGTAVSITGLEAQIPFFLGYILNSSLEFTHMSLDVNIGSVTNTKFFLNLLQKKSDIVVPPTLLNLERYKKAQISIVYKYVELSWMRPPQRRIKTWVKILHSFFNNSVILFFCVTFFIFVSVTKLITKYNTLRIKYKSDILINTYSIFIGQETKFETKIILVNSLFIMWVWFCIILRLVIQGDLTSGLQNIYLEPPWTSMHYAIKNVDGYGGGLMFKNVFEGTELENDYKVVNAYDADINVRNVAKGQRFILLTDKTAVNLFLLGTNVQYIGPPVITIPSCMYIRPGWPAAERIINLIQKMVEVGFIAKASKDILHTNMIKLNNSDILHSNNDPQPLSLDDFRGFIYILLFLLCLCFVIFIIEVLYYNIHAKHVNL